MYIYIGRTIILSCIVQWLCSTYTLAAVSDFTVAMSTAVTIPSSETATTVSIAITDDNVVELQESFTVQLTVPDGQGGVTLGQHTEKH